MMYFDNAATSMPKAPGVSQAAAQAIDSCASIGRGGHSAARRAADLAFQCREEAGLLFDISPDCIVFTMNATHALNIAIRSLVEEGDDVVISGFEHNAVVRPLTLIGAKIHAAGTRLFDPADTRAAFVQALSCRPKAVICTHVSNVFGYRLPIEEIAALCREQGIPLIIDASQSAGILPLSMAQLQPAFLAMPGHKGLLGPQGTGLLLCGQMPKPLLAGGTGSLSQSSAMPDFLPDAAEAGTHNLPGIAGLLEGLRYIRRQTPDKIREKEALLLQVFRQALKADPRITGYFGPPQLQTAVASLDFPGHDCEEMAARLAAHGIAVRAGLHCAPLAHQSAGTLEKGTVRFSFSSFQEPEEIKEACRIMKKMI